MADCKACGAWFGTATPQDLCPTCERAMNRLKNYAVPVVRCKDCWNATKMGGFMGEVLYCPIWERNTDDECFCSYGERKDGEG